MPGAAGPRLTIIPLIVGFIALAMIVIMTFLMNQGAQRNFDEVTAGRALRVAAVELRSALQAAESSQRGYLYTGNEVYLAPYDVAKSHVRKQFDIVQAGLVDFPDLKDAGDRLNSVIQQKQKEMDDSVGLKRKGDDAGALALVQSNKGKAYMDEANVFLSGIVRATDDRMITAVKAQQDGISFLRWVSIIGAVVMVGMVVLGWYFVTSHTKGLSDAQDAVTALNLGLEERVKNRTAELGRANDELRVARDRAETLLAEVNHRVANSLAMVSTLVKLQANSITDKTAKDALAETQARIHAVSLVHRKLYTSGDVKVVALDDYLTGIIEHLQTSMQNQLHGISLKYDLDHITLSADQSTNLGVIVNEWVSNAIKYAYPDEPGAIRIKLAVAGDGMAELTVADDGVGFDPKKQAKGTGFGTRIVRAMASSLQGTVEYLAANPGAVAKLIFPVQPVVKAKAQEA